MDIASRYRGFSKSVIRCPQCNARHYQTRSDRKDLDAYGYYDVHCSCGYIYRIKALKDTLIISGRRVDNGQ